MKKFNDHVEDIHRNFIMGLMPKRLALHNFEYLLKNFSLMPPGEELDPNMTDDDFLLLLSEAMDLNPKGVTEKNPCAEVDSGTDLQYAGGGGERHYNPGRLGTRGTLGGNVCPVCGKQKEIFSGITDENNRNYPVNPPRCEDCMWKYAEKNIINPYIPDTEMRAMNQEDRDFFRQYEEQMKGGIK